MPFKIVKNDITKLKADAIVKIVNNQSGNISVTQELNQKTPYIIETAAPIWVDGRHEEESILSTCYDESLKKAEELKCNSIAFPLICSDENGFPKDIQLQIAISAISQFLMKSDILVYLVVSDRKSLGFSDKLFQEIDSFLDENYIKENKIKENKIKEKKLTINPSQYQEEPDYGICEQICMPSNLNASHCLDDVMNDIGETFQQKLLRLIDEKGLTDTCVYKSANIDRKLFSKIRCNVDYKPRKKTAVALAIALELDIDDTKDLLARAEIAFSPSSKFDLIIEYFISRKVFDVYKINMALFKHNQPILG